MSGTDDSSDEMECEGQNDSCNAIDKFVAAIAGLSLKDQQGLKRPRKVGLRRLSQTTSGQSTDVQVSPTKRRVDDVTPEEDVQLEQKSLTDIKQEEPESTAAQEGKKTDCESAEMAEREVKVVKARARRGGVTHRRENTCCPALPSTFPLPASHMDLLMEDFRAMGYTLCPKSYWI